MEVQIVRSDGRQDIFLPMAGRKEMKLIREKLIGFLSGLTLEKEKGIEISEVKRMPRTRSWFFHISSESESEEFDPRLNQLIEEIISSVLIQERRRNEDKGKNSDR